MSVSALADGRRAGPADAATSGWRRCAIRAPPRDPLRRVVAGSVTRAIAGDGVVGATGAVDGRPIACYAQDGGVPRRLARRASRGHDRARPADRRPGAAPGRRRSSSPAARGCRRARGARRLRPDLPRDVALTGVVPQISVVSGTSAGGGAYSPALTDLIVMTEDAAMFLTGPGVVREALGEEIDAAELGGPRVHDRNGVCHLVEADEPAAAARVRELLGYLPRGAGERPPRSLPLAPTAAATDPGGSSQRRPRSVYDVRDALVGRSSTAARCSSCALGGRATSSPRWPGSRAGRSAIVANQPRHLGGVLDAEASEKARPVRRLCNSFGLPLIAVVDTPGFMPGSEQEQAGVIRHGASLVRAFARGARAEAHRRPAQVLRRRLHHDELPRSGRRPRARLAEAEIGIMAAARGRDRTAASSPPTRPGGRRARLAAAYAEEHPRPSRRGERDRRRAHRARGDPRSARRGPRCLR